MTSFRLNKFGKRWLAIVGCLVVTLFSFGFQAASAAPDPTYGAGTVVGILDTGDYKLLTVKDGVVNQETVAFILGKLVSPLVYILGAVLMAIVVYAGVLWMTAGGNTEQIGKAKKLLSNGIIGLAVVVLSFIIVTFVFNQIQSSVPS